MLRRSRILLVVLAVLGGLLSTATARAASAAPTAVPGVQTSPTLSGDARVGSTLTADPGTWVPEATSYRFTWLRDGQVIHTTTTPSRTLTVTDLNHRIAVRVTAENADGSSSPATSAESATVRRGSFAFAGKVRILGVRRWDHTLTASYGATTPTPTAVSYQWLRDGTPIKGATRKRYAVTVADFAHRLNVRVTLRRAGWFPAVRASGETSPIGHRVAVRRTFTYSIATRGSIRADLGTFTRLTAATLADPRGWRAAGFAFRRVASGGDFRLYLSAAGSLPSFGYPCSTMWSCRVGNNVIINQDRWLNASPAWNAQGLALRDYRHMVVNHETGHWLGHRHSSCPGKGRLAPVMMQQSKGLNGCRFNPFPLPGERWSSR